MKTRRSGRLARRELVARYSSPAVVALLLTAASTAGAIASHQTIATELQEVRRASVNGRDYLTIRIPHRIGPLECQGSVLTVDTASLPQNNGRSLMETVALKAMLTAESVVITVPMATDQCIDGKPTITDMYRLPAIRNGLH